MKASFQCGFSQNMRERERIFYCWNGNSINWMVQACAQKRCIRFCIELWSIQLLRHATKFHRMLIEFSSILKLPRTSINKYNNSSVICVIVHFGWLFNECYSKINWLNSLLWARIAGAGIDAESKWNDCFQLSMSIYWDLFVQADSSEWMSIRKQYRTEKYHRLIKIQVKRKSTFRRIWWKAFFSWEGNKFPV